MTESANEIKIPSFETQRLLIRPLTREHVGFLFDHYSQPEVSRFALISFDSLEDAYDFYEGWCNPGDSTRFRLIIVLKETHELIGTICYVNWSRNNRSAEIGYSLSPDYWGRGYMVEALQPLIQFGFEGMNLNRLEATTNIENNQSQRLLQRLGFKKEGVLRQKYYFNGRFSDEMIFSLLRDEWMNFKKC
ncbi:MAG: GNAT family N-acetyltransferase [Candidatus Hodarchaeota archaeon]